MDWVLIEVLTPNKWSVQNNIGVVPYIQPTTSYVFWGPDSDIDISASTHTSLQSRASSCVN